MGYFRISLDMISVPICSVLLGLIVDDTIYLLYWQKKTNSINDSISMAGPGMIVTSICLLLGFSVLLLAASPPVVTFGVLISCGVIVALFADLFLLPRFMDIMKIHSDKNEPQQTMMKHGLT